MIIIIIVVGIGGVQVSGQHGTTQGTDVIGGWIHDNFIRPSLLGWRDGTIGIMMVTMMIKVQWTDGTIPSVVFVIVTGCFNLVGNVFFGIFTTTTIMIVHPLIKYDTENRKHDQCCSTSC